MATPTRPATGTHEYQDFSGCDYSARLPPDRRTKGDAARQCERLEADGWEIVTVQVGEMHPIYATRSWMVLARRPL